MRLLVLGGTAWLGGRVAAHAVAAGHDVVCLARGLSGAVPDGAMLLARDRLEPGAYDAIGHVDAAVEVSWQPDQVRAAVAGVDADHWVYVSSISVYGEGRELVPPWTGSGEATREEYGSAKVSCEQAFAHRESSTYLVARAGLIGGYGDPSDRLGYWPARLAAAREGRQPVLVPAPTSAPAQVIDVEDLAAWLVRAATARIFGTYDAVGPATTLQGVLDASAAAAGASPTFQPVDGTALVAAGVNPWAGPESLPLWLGDADAAALMCDPEPAVRAGLHLRALEETVAEALSWETRCGLGRERRSGLSPQRESELLRSLA